MKKILFVSVYSGFYGSEKMFALIVRMLQDRFKAVSFIGGIVSVPPSFMESVNGIKSEFNIIGKGSVRFSFKSLIFWIKKIIQEKPDKILVNISLIPEVVLAAWILRKPVYVFVRESLIDHKIMFFFYSYYLNSFSTKIITNSDYTRSMFKNKSKICTVYDTLDPFPKVSVDPKRLMRIHKSQTVKILYVGRLSYRKGLSLIQEALSLFEGTNNDFDIEFHLYGDVRKGDEDYLSSISEGMDKLTKTKVLFLGYRDAPYMNDEYFCMVAPSTLPETFGLTVLESLSHGIPVVANDVGAYNELIKSNSNGILFSQTSQSLLDGILKLKALSYDEYLVYCQNGLSTAAKYSEDKYLAQLYKSIS